MIFKLDAKTIALVTAGLTAVGGGVEMRIAVARLEVAMAGLDKRVERIEKELDDKRPRYSKFTPEHE